MATDKSRRSDMRITKHLIPIVIMAACNTSPGPKTGAESHFMEVCSAETDCADALSCVCGVCTLTCNTPADCDAIGTAASCRSSEFDTRTSCTQGGQQNSQICSDEGSCCVLGDEPSCANGVSCCGDGSWTCNDASGASACSAQVGVGQACPADPCADAFLCTTFEDLTFSEWDDVQISGSAELAATTTPVYRGARALEVRVSKAPDKAALSYQFPTPFTDGELWVRGWINVPAAYGPTSLASYAYLSEALAPFQFVDSTLTTTTGYIFRDRSDVAADVDLEGAVDMSDTWRCFEWHVVLGSVGRMSLYVDSALIVDSGTVNMEVQGGGFTHLFIGQGDPRNLVPGSALYIDDLIISSKRVSCGFNL